MRCGRRQVAPAMCLSRVSVLAAVTLALAGCKVVEDVSYRITDRSIEQVQWANNLRSGEIRVVSDRLGDGLQVTLFPGVTARIDVERAWEHGEAGLVLALAYLRVEPESAMLSQVSFDMPCAGWTLEAGGEQIVGSVDACAGSLALGDVVDAQGNATRYIRFALPRPVVGPLAIHVPPWRVHLPMPAVRPPEYTNDVEVAVPRFVIERQVERHSRPLSVYFPH
jgi:hypothetical protein